MSAIINDVTSIVGCFMQEQYVEKAYWSAVNQDYVAGDIEVIIYHDNCSIGQGTGASNARNTAIGQANHDWIICLDADDLLPSNYVSTLMNTGLEVMGWGPQWFVGCPVQFISGRDLARFGDAPTGGYGLKDFKASVPHIPAAAMFAKEAWRSVGGYEKGLPTMEDFEFWYRLMDAGCSYYHTTDTVLLKNNDGNGKVHRVGTKARQN